MIEPVWIAWAVLIPLLGALVTYAAGRRAALVAVPVALGTSCAVAGLLYQVATHGPVRHAVGAWAPPLGIALRADGIAVLMLAMVALVGVLLTVYAASQSGAEGLPPSFFPLWCLTWGALNALLLSGDIFNMYVALELTTLAAVALLGATGKPPALAAALHYLLFAMVGSLAYLAGVVVLYGAHSVLDAGLLDVRAESGPPAWLALSLMMAGLTLKAGLFPFHAFLPPAYSSGPAVVSVVLAALVGKSAFYVLLRVWIDVFPSFASTWPAQLVGALGAAAVVWGGLLALQQRRLSMLLAYSSVSQIGFFFLLFPLPQRPALPGVMFLLLSHAVAIGAMFVAVGTIRRALGSDDLEGLQGLGHRFPVTFVALGLAGMSLIGMPPSGGFVGKWLLARCALEAGQPIWSAVLLGGGLLTAGYVFRLLRRAFLPLPEGVAVAAVPRLGALVSLSLALASVALGLLPWLPLTLMRAGSHGP